MKTRLIDARGFSSCFSAGSRTHTLLQLPVVSRCLCTGTQSDRSPTAPKKLRHADTCKIQQQKQQQQRHK
jgi:hypothetical protein